MKNLVARIRALITADNSDLKKKMNETRNETKKTGSSMKKMGKVVKAVMATAAVAAAAKLIKKMAQVRMEFEKYEAMLKVALGSQQEAALAMKQLTNFAAETPFQLNELTNSYVKLVNQGMKPAKEEMRALGDLSAAMGKDFSQLTEAVIDAATGEFERLKEFGIRAEKDGDKVTFAFKGVKTQVDFTSKAIQDYIVGLGNLNGVQGSMAEISATLGGRVSNLGDAWTTLLNTMGQQTGGILMGVVNMMINLAKVLDENIKRTRRFKEEYRDESVQNALDGMIEGVEYWTKINKKAGDDAVKARQRAIATQLSANQKFIEDQKKLMQQYLDDENQKQADKVAFTIKTQKMAAAALKSHYVEVGRLEMEAIDAQMAAEAAKFAQLEALRQQDLSKERQYWQNKIGTMGIAKAEAEGLTYAEVSLTKSINSASQAAAQNAVNLQQTAATLPTVTTTTQQAAASTDQWSVILGGLKSSFEVGDIDTAMNSIMSRATQMSNSIAESFNNVTLAAGYSQEQVDKAQADMSKNFKLTAKAAANAARQEIQVWISKGVASAVSKALSFLPPPFNVAAAAAAGIAATALFNRVIPSFAEGGVVSGPQLAMVGDNPGKKEAIIPSELWGSGGGGPVVMDVKIKGSDLWLSQQRFGNTLTRAGR